jgi:hypothetical protein
VSKTRRGERCSTIKLVILGERQGQERIGSLSGVTLAGKSTDTQSDQHSEVESVVARRLASVRRYPMHLRMGRVGEAMTVCFFGRRRSLECSVTFSDESGHRSRSLRY